MTFAVSTSLGQETIGVRMEFLASNAAIRADALKRLVGGANPIAVAQTLTDGATYIDIFGEDITSFKTTLDNVLGGGQGAAYEARVKALKAEQQDTRANREHVMKFWLGMIAVNPALADQIRSVFIQALEAAGPIQVRWGQPKVTGKKSGSAEYKSGEVVMTIDAGL